MKRSDFFEYHDNFAINAKVVSRLKWGNESGDMSLVSICIPTFRRPLLLKEAIISVLQQRDFSDFEIVIVDNDNEELYATEIISYLNEINDPRVRYYINDSNIGVFGNWNRCIELSHGIWMTILSDDDLLFDDYLVTLTNEIKQNSGLTRVECRYQIFSDSSNIVSTKKQRRRYDFTRKIIGDKCNVSYETYLFGCFTAPHTQLYKRDLAYRVGGFNASFAPISDYVFNAKYLYNYPGGVFINHYLCGYRWSVNASQNRVVKAGLCRWNRAFRKYLLAKKISYRNNILVYCLDQLELELLVKNYSFAQKLIRLILKRVVFSLQRSARIPSQIGAD